MCRMYASSCSQNTEISSEEAPYTIIPRPPQDDADTNSKIYLTKTYFPAAENMPPSCGIIEPLLRSKSKILYPHTQPSAHRSCVVHSSLLLVCLRLQTKRVDGDASWHGRFSGCSGTRCRKFSVSADTRAACSRDPTLFFPQQQCSQ